MDGPYFDYLARLIGSRLIRRSGLGLLAAVRPIGRNPFESIAGKTEASIDQELLARISRRWMMQGGVGAFLAGGSYLLGDPVGEARKRRKKKKKKNKKRNNQDPQDSGQTCPGGCSGAEI